MSEKELRQTLLNELRSLPESFACRIENSASIGGQVGSPDVFFCVGGYNGWVETKFKAEKPSRLGTAAFAKGGLRPAQADWLNSYQAAGGNCWILAQIGSLAFLMHGSWANRFNDLVYQDFLENAAFVVVMANPKWRDCITYMTIDGIENLPGVSCGTQTGRISCTKPNFSFVERKP